MKKQLIIAALVITLLSGVLYVAVQQAYRRGANEPQGSMASDVAAALDNGAKPTDLVKGRQVDMSTNMSPFIIIYDKTGKVVAGNGYLNEEVPRIPVGVLQTARESGKDNKVTWQPEKKVRIASVSVATRNYYVLGGRSLAVVEKSIQALTRWMVATWLACMVILLSICMIAVRHQRKSIARLSEG